MIELYRTIAEKAEGIYKEKGSKFFAFAIPVSTEAMVKQQLAAIRKEFYDARHHCYAYVLKPDKSVFRANDDGEPNHSAGDPILGQIRSRDLTDVLVVVVRYFGGIKLGVGGLINAYKSAASDALDHASIIEKDVLHAFTLSYEYADTTEIMRLLKEVDARIQNQQFDQTCRIDFHVRIGHVALVYKRIKLLQDLGHKVSLKDHEAPI